MSNSGGCLPLALFIFLYGVYSCGVLGIRLTSLQVPTHAVLGADARLECRFDLEGEALYAVKWYKDGNEFYQYVPLQDPPTQDFPSPGINVDLERSSRNILTLTSVGAGAAGVYRCEVSGEAPNFSTVSDGGQMEVVVLPQDGPSISGGSTHYMIGDVADLNCTSAASKPEAKLTWLVNERQAPPHAVRDSWVTPLSDGTLVVTSHLRFRVTSHHFRRGQLMIKCVATIASMYERADGHSADDVAFPRPLPASVVDQSVPVSVQGPLQPYSETSLPEHATSSATWDAPSSPRFIASTITAFIICLNT